MPGVLIIAHAPLASALKQVAAHTYAHCAGAIEAFDVAATMQPEQVEARARELLERVCNPDAIVFTDVFGATPCNVAQRLAAAHAGGGQVRVVTGVNVPMLWRALCYAGEPIEAVVARAVTGALQGVMQVSTTRPQNQTRKPIGHDQNHRQHQQ